MPTAKHKRPIDIETRYCLQCRYPLRGLSDHRCPECGKRFDPADLATTSAIARQERLWPTWFCSHVVRTNVLAVAAAASLSPFGVMPTLYRQRYGYPNGPILICGIVLLWYFWTVRRPIWGWHTIVAVGIAAGMFALYIGPEFVRFSYDMNILLPFVFPVLFIPVSIVHARRCNSNSDSTSRFLGFLPALFAWCYLALIVGLVVMGEESNPIDYWTYWFWIADPW